MDEMRIDPSEANELRDAVFVDARNPQAWSESTKKIPGAIRMPANAPESRFEEIPRDRSIVTYCT